MKHLLVYAGLAAVICVSSGANALAKKVSDSPLQTLYKCTEITEPTARLACYDKAASYLHKAEEKKEIVTIDAAIAETIKKEAFGFKIPSLPKLGLKKIGTDTKRDTLTVKVKSVREAGQRYIFVFENGQKWREVGGHKRKLPRGELTATIIPKSLGSYLMSVTNGKSTARQIRVRRVQ